MNDTECTRGTGGYRSYGNTPSKVAVIHGGPSAPGRTGSLAGIISCKVGVSEPFQSAHVTCGQLEGLFSFIGPLHDAVSLSLAGQSGGARLGSTFIAVRASTADELILVLAGMFDLGLNNDFTITRLERLDMDERRKAACFSETLIDGLPEADPHPAEAVRDKFSTIPNNFRSTLRKRCGHSQRK